MTRDVRDSVAETRPLIVIIIEGVWVTLITGVLEEVVEEVTVFDIGGVDVCVVDPLAVRVVVWDRDDVVEAVGLAVDRVENDPVAVFRLVYVLRPDPLALGLDVLVFELLILFVPLGVPVPVLLGFTLVVIVVDDVDVLVGLTEVVPVFVSRRVREVKGLAVPVREAAIVVVGKGDCVDVLLGAVERVA